jgi:hypothetical protein
VDNLYLIRYKRHGNSGWYYLAPIRTGASGLQDRIDMAVNTDRAAQGQRRPYKVEVIRVDVAEVMWEGKPDDPIIVDTDRTATVLN